MAHTNSSNIENLLAAATDALLADRDLEQISREYNVPRDEVDRLLGVIHRLHTTLTGVEPSKRFTQRLKRDLLSTPRRGVIARVRYLPARVQITAAIALTAGFMLLLRRRLISDATQDAQEVPALQ